MHKLRGYVKPIASRRGQKLFPVCYVDSTIKVAGRPLTSSECILEEPERPCKNRNNRDSPELQHQMPVAAAQWGSLDTHPPPTLGEKPWLKSWYYPLDAFDPWPVRTDVCCWWDTCPFDWTPFPLPYQYDSGSNRYRSVGMFCGPSCAKAYAARVKGYPNIDSVFYYIETIAEDFYGYRLHMEAGKPKRSAIPTAPNKEILQKYCGPEGMTIEQYRNACACGRDIKILPPAWTTMKQVVQAEQQVACRGRSRVIHRENPDHIERTQDLVRKHRIPFAGLGAKRMTDYLQQKS